MANGKRRAATTNDPSVDGKWQMANICLDEWQTAEVMNGNWQTATNENALANGNCKWQTSVANGKQNWQMANDYKRNANESGSIAVNFEQEADALALRAGRRPQALRDEARQSGASGRPAQHCIRAVSCTTHTKYLNSYRLLE
eukprot:gene16681-biopygen8276